MKISNFIKRNNPLISSYRFVELDSLRGIAVIIVFLYHYTYAYNYSFKSFEETNFLFLYGELGVQLFFIISGFVIFMSLENTTSVSNFFISRFTRLYPTYWFSIIITVLFTLSYPIPNFTDYSIKQILMNLTMIQGIFKIPHIDGVYWTLQIELFFYIIVGFLFKFRLLNKIEVVSIIWLFLSFIRLFVDLPFEKLLKNLLILEWSPLFIAGMMFYKIKFKDSTYINHLIIILSMIVFLFNLYFQHLEKLNIPTDSMTYYLLLVSIFLLFYILIYFEIKIFKNKILLFLGYISYPFYLLHEMIGFSIIYRLKQIYDNQFFYIFITTIFTIFLAYVVTKIMEKPSKLIKKVLTQKLIKTKEK